MPPDKRRHRWVRVLVTLIIVSAVLAGAWVAAFSFRHPPVASLEKALAAVAEARRLGASEMAPTLLKEAEDDLRYAQQAIAEENARLLPIWSYAFADSLLHEAASAAERAGRATVEKQQTRRTQVQNALAEITRDVRTWSERLRNGLTLLECERLLVRAKTTLNLATDLVNKGSHPEAMAFLDSTSHLVDRLAEQYGSYQEQSERENGAWRRWVQQTVERSAASGSYAVIVDKLAHRLFLLKAGKITKSYACDLGYNSGHQKRRSGDGATPEGMYRVTAVKQHSKYHKALLVNYPNDADRARYRKNVRAGLVRAGAHLGGLIEIHGEGGAGRDWTDGCVAVTNKHMDELMRIASVGMPVTIVRSSGLKK